MQLQSLQLSLASSSFIQHFSSNLQLSLAVSSFLYEVCVDCFSFLEILKVLEVFLREQSSGGVLRKWCSENMQQIYRRLLISKCDFNKGALHWFSPVNLVHIFRTILLKNASGRLLLIFLNNLGRSRYSGSRWIQRASRASRSSRTKRI